MSIGSRPLGIAQGEEYPLGGATLKKVGTVSLPETTRRPRGRPKVMPDESQRSLIAERARELFLEKGYGRTTTDDVAARCRISKHTLYRLFPGKPALFAAIVDAHRQSVLALPGDYDELPLGEALERIFKIDIDPQADKERVALLNLVLLEARQFPELADIARRYGGDRSRAELANWLDRQCKRGRLRIDDADSAARMLIGMIYSDIVDTASGNVRWLGGKKRNDYIRRCVSVFLHGVVPR